MRHWLNIACLFVLCAFVESCGMDDYPEPGETLEGAVIDCFTNEPIVTEQPNGYRIKMEDIGWSDNSVPWYFWGKADGTFQNTKVYASKYIVTPVEGAFMPVEGVTLDIKGTVEHNFVVTPYVSIDVVEIKGEDGCIKVTYSVTNNGDSDLQDAMIYVAKDNPNIGANFSDKSVKRTLKNADSGVQFTNEVTGLEPGETYYVRVAARAKNSSNRYNMTKAVKVDL